VQHYHKPVTGFGASGRIGFAECSLPLVISAHINAVSSYYSWNSFEIHNVQNPAESLLGADFVDYL